ncbi:MAG: hypothetical protein R3E93_07255 [Thiothrix sp.]
MFKVFLDGTYHSTHRTFAEACRNARIQSERYQHSYFTVFEAMDEIGHPFHANSDTLCGVPDYIITPSENVAHGAISVPTASSLLRVRLPSHTFGTHERTGF